MGNWYRVTKTIKGHPYAYLQRSWREGKSVRTQSHYIGPAAGHGKAANPIAYHGARDGLTGEPAPSDSGTFGPGLYLTDQERAGHYATYDAKSAADLAGLAVPPPPTYAGSVHAFDLSGLTILTLKDWNAYFDLVDKLLDDPKGYATPDDKRQAQHILVDLGYDGIDMQDADRRETVIFPDAVSKLQEVNTTSYALPAADDGEGSLLSVTKPVDRRYSGSTGRTRKDQSNSRT